MIAVVFTDGPKKNEMVTGLKRPPPAAYYVATSLREAEALGIPAILKYVPHGEPCRLNDDTIYYYHVKEDSP